MIGGELVEQSVNDIYRDWLGQEPVETALLYCGVSFSLAVYGYCDKAWSAQWCNRAIATNARRPTEVKWDKRLCVV